MTPAQAIAGKPDSAVYAPLPVVVTGGRVVVGFKGGIPALDAGPAGPGAGVDKTLIVMCETGGGT